MSYMMMICSVLQKRLVLSSFYVHINSLHHAIVLQFNDQAYRNLRLTTICLFQKVDFFRASCTLTLDPRS